MTFNYLLLSIYGLTKIIDKVLDCKNINLTLYNRLIFQNNDKYINMGSIKITFWENYFQVVTFHIFNIQQLKYYVCYCCLLKMQSL